MKVIAITDYLKKIQNIQTFEKCLNSSTDHLESELVPNASVCIFRICTRRWLFVFLMIKDAPLDCFEIGSEANLLIVDLPVHRSHLRGYSIGLILTKRHLLYRLTNILTDMLSTLVLILIRNHLSSGRVNENTFR